eukprot:6188926-Pleurochrysis_carterae.AAC.6
MSFQYSGGEIPEPGGLGLRLAERPANGCVETCELAALSLVGMQPLTSLEISDRLQFTKICKSCKLGDPSGEISPPD